MLAINGITVRLGGRTILDRASAAIPPGGRVGLIGRNGAGKSTLMKVMIGELDPDEGEIEMPRRTRLGYIAQDAPSGTTTPDRGRAGRRYRTRQAAGRIRKLHRSAPAGRHSRAAAGDRCLYRAVARGAHPHRAGLRRGDAGPAARQFFRRLADARGAGRAAVFRARRAAARRAFEPPRSRSDACGWRTSSRPIRRRWWSSATSATCSTMSSTISCICRAAS